MRQINARDGKDGKVRTKERKNERKEERKRRGSKLV